MPNRSRQAHSSFLRLSSYSWHPNRNSLAINLTFPSTVLPPSICQALMVSRSDDIKFLDESKPIPSQSRFVDPNLHTSPKSNSFSNLNCECRWNGGILFALLPLAFYSHIMLTLTTSIGHPKFKITITITITRILEHIKTCHDPVCFRVETEPECTS